MIGIFGIVIMVVVSYLGLWCYDWIKVDGLIMILV